MLVGLVAVSRLPTEQSVLKVLYLTELRGRHDAPRDHQAGAMRVRAVRAKLRTAKILSYELVGRLFIAVWGG